MSDLISRLRAAGTGEAKLRLIEQTAGGRDASECIDEIVAALRAAGHELTAKKFLSLSRPNFIEQVRLETAAWLGSPAPKPAGSPGTGADVDDEATGETSDVEPVVGTVADADPTPEPVVGVGDEPKPKAEYRSRKRRGD